MESIQLSTIVVILQFKINYNEETKQVQIQGSQGRFLIKNTSYCSEPEIQR